jgi:membrane-bound acyltransferase YfiQ involved in biofilm formation
VSNIRFLAMFSIVFIHATGTVGTAGGVCYDLQKFLFLQAAKFGTIGFFLISGFLLGEGMTRTAPSRYFKRRVRAISLPWALWVTVWFLTLLPQLIHDDRQNVQSGLGQAVSQYLHLVFIGSYWFVPNFLFCLALVLFLYHRVSNRIQGPVFLAASLFYAANIYLGIVPRGHCSAIFGYVFYLWLGACAYRHRERFERWLRQVPWASLIAAVAVAGFIAAIEMHRLIPYDQGLNTLRLSNQLYSVLAVIAIAKFRFPLMPKFIHPRTETFGIFLIHPVLYRIWLLTCHRLPLTSPLHNNGPLTLSLVFLVFVLTYLASLWLTKRLGANQNLKWTIGM